MPDYDEIEREFHTQTGSAKPCPSLELLMAAGQGVLPPDVEQRTSAHLQTCGLCQMLVRDFAELPELSLTPAQSARIRAGIPREQQASHPPAAMNYRMAFAIAAMVLMTVCGVAAYRLFRAPQNTITTTASVTPPPALAPLEKLAPPDMALGMTSRGEQQHDSPSAEELQPAFEAYNAADYGRAEKAFSELARQYPKSDLPVLYLGVTDLLLDHNRQAADALTSAQLLAGPARRESAAWYRAVAAQRTKDPTAPQRFAAICTEGGSYASHACPLVKLPAS